MRRYLFSAVVDRAELLRPPRPDPPLAPTTGQDVVLTQGDHLLLNGETYVVTRAGTGSKGAAEAVGARAAELPKPRRSNRKQRRAAAAKRRRA